MTLFRALGKPLVSSLSNLECFRNTQFRVETEFDRFQRGRKYSLKTFLLEKKAEIARLSGKHQTNFNRLE